MFYAQIIYDTKVLLASYTTGIYIIFNETIGKLIPVSYTEWCINNDSGLPQARDSVCMMCLIGNCDFPPIDKSRFFCEVAAVLLPLPESVTFYYSIQ